MTRRRSVGCQLSGVCLLGRSTEKLTASSPARCGIVLSQSDFGFRVKSPGCNFSRPLRPCLRVFQVCSLRPRPWECVGVSGGVHQSPAPFEVLVQLRQSLLLRLLRCPCCAAVICDSTCYKARKHRGALLSHGECYLPFSAHAQVQHLHLAPMCVSVLKSCLF